MEIKFSQQAVKDIRFWKNNDQSKIDKIYSLISNIQETPFSGIGKPEALKGNLSGYWSRRIDKEHRLIYSYQDNQLTIISARYHYNK